MGGQILFYQNEIDDIEILIFKYETKKEAMIEGFNMYNFPKRGKAYQYKKKYKSAICRLKTEYNNIEHKMLDLKNKMSNLLIDIETAESEFNDLKRYAVQQAILQDFGCETCNSSVEEALKIYEESHIFTFDEKYECKFCNTFIHPLDFFDHLRSVRHKLNLPKSLIICTHCKASTYVFICEYTVVKKIM